MECTLSPTIHTVKNNPFNKHQLAVTQLIAGHREEYIEIETWTCWNTSQLSTSVSESRSWPANVRVSAFASDSCSSVQGVGLRVKGVVCRL